MIVPLLVLLSLAVPPKDPLSAALERYEDVSSYRVTLRSRHGTEEEVIRYYYKKPGFVRMEFIKPHGGALLVYDPATRAVRLRPFGFLPSFVLTLSPGNSLVKSASGHRVDESDIGSLLRQVKRLREHGTFVPAGEDTVGGKEALVVCVEGNKGVSLEGIHRYLIWFDKATQLPLKTATFDSSGNPVEEVLMDDLEVNIPLRDSLFRL
ncbi:MAG TPA: sigma-E factor regulatory protein RseB domain-containing protein [Desulfuromonadaceae bacterium]